MPNPLAPPLKETFLSYVMPPEAWQQVMGDNEGWGEVLTGDDSPTGKPMILINDKKFEGASKNYREKFALLEGLHLLKDVDPERYMRIKMTAVRDPNYMRWAKERYDHARSQGEQRDFWKHHDVSSFDQVMGGYIGAGDPDFPSLKGWDRNKLPIGPELRAEFEELRKELFGPTVLSP